MAPHTICAEAVKRLFDFNSCSVEDVQRFEIPLDFAMSAVTHVHGIALWFDCKFPGAQREVTLSTGPLDPLTHWYQVRCMLRAPLAVGPGHALTGTMLFEANESRGFNVHMRVRNANTGVEHTNTVVTQCALHHFQYTTQQSAAAYYPPQQQAQAVAAAPYPDQSAEMA